MSYFAVRSILLVIYMYVLADLLPRLTDFSSIDKGTRKLGN